MEKKNEKIKNTILNDNLNRLKYYRTIAKALNIEYPITHNIHEIFLDFTNGYMRGYKALDIEIKNLEEIINNPKEFKEKNKIDVDTAYYNGERNKN